MRLFLSVITHKPDETLYLAISLTKLFKKIKEEINNEKGVKFSNFTSFLCNVRLNFNLENFVRRPWLSCPYEINCNGESYSRFFKS